MYWQLAKEGKQIANSYIGLLTIKVDHSYYDFLAFGSYYLPTAFNQQNNL